MVYIPFIYFLILLLHFWRKSGRWSLDVAAVSVLLVILAAAIGIDALDLYDQYGCNRNCLNGTGITLFCLEWTLIFQLLHTVSSKELLPEIDPTKQKLLTFVMVTMVASICIAVGVKMSDIRLALGSDFGDVRNQHYDDLTFGTSKSGRNIFMYLPGIFAATPFPTLALLWWLYGLGFNKFPTWQRGLLLLVSTTHILTGILIAGRAAIIYWCIDFYLILCYFWPHITHAIRVRITTIGTIVGGLIVGMFLMVTIARFNNDRSNPMYSLIGYAGQHLNNFCAVIEYGADAPMQTGRIFPLTNKILYGKTFNLYDHYGHIEDRLSIIVHNFDTFGGEVYLDFGAIGLAILLLLLIYIVHYVKKYVQYITFPDLILLSIMIAFYSKGLFAWPFTGHYATLGILTTLLLYIALKYHFKFK